MDDLQSYGIKLEVQAALAALAKFKKSTAAFNAVQEKALNNQITLQKRLNDLRDMGSKIPTAPQTIPQNIPKPVTPKPSPVNEPKPVKPKSLPLEPVSQPKPKDKPVQHKPMQAEIDFNIVEKAIEKRKAKETKDTTVREVSIVKTELTEKARKDKVESSRRKQAVASITEPTGAGDMKAFYENQNKQIKASDKLKSETLKKQESEFAKVQAALTKRLEKEQQRRTDIAVGHTKRRMQAEKEAAMIETARRRQAVNKITEPSDSGEMRKFYQNEQRTKGTEPDSTPRVKTAKQLAREEERRVAALELAKNNILHTSFMLKKQKKFTDEVTQDIIRQKIEYAKTAREVRNIYKVERARASNLTTMSQRLRAMKEDLRSSASGMVTGAGLGLAGVGITQIGQDFEATRNTMLSVSTTAEESAENLAFVRQEAVRLGVSMGQSAKQYAKMVAAQGEMSDQDLRQSFLGIAEMSTVMGLSTAESGRAFTALTQIMSKGQVMAEELKGQLGEVMPNALQVMAKAAQDAGISTDGSVKSLMELMENGKVMANEVLPHFARRMRETASTGLEKALNQNRVAMGRMVAAFQIAADTFFQSGFGDGLTDVFNSITEMITDNEVLWKSLGAVIGAALEGVAWLIRGVVSPILSALGSILNAIVDYFGKLSGALVLVAAKFGMTGKATTELWKAFGKGTTPLKMIGTIFTGILRAVMLLIGGLEELAEFLSPTGKQTLIGTNLPELLKTSGMIEMMDKITGMFGSIGTVVSDISSGISDSVNSIGNVKMPDTVGYGAGVMAAGGRSSMSSSTYPIADRARYAQQDQKIVVKGDIILDGNKVGEQVMNTESARSAINYEMASKLGGNY